MSIKRPFSDDDELNPFEWYQGHFIDQRQYDRMPEEWKEEQRQREKTLVRDHRSKNGVFMVTGAPENAAVVEAIIALRNYALELERQLKEGV